MFKLTTIDSNTIQISGNVNGFAIKRSENDGAVNGSYKLYFKYFKNNCLYKIETNDKDGTIRTTDAIISRINRTMQI